MDAAELPGPARTILHTLLDRFEQPGRQQVVRVRLTERDHPAYFSPSDAAPRRATHQALEQLARQQILALRWRRWEEGNWLDAVDLRPEGSGALYRLLGRAPRVEQEDALRAMLNAQTPLPGWHEAFLSWAAGQLDAGRSAPPLDRENLGGSGDLLRALAALASLEAPTLERALSVRLFADSKRLAALRGGLLRVLRRHDPEASLYGDDDDALLRAHQLDRAPEYVPLAGPLTLRPPAGGSLLMLEPFAPSVALPAPLLRAAQVAELRASAVITVENLTSFTELCAARPPGVLALYTGGFASPTVVGLLRALRKAAPSLELWHWGDLDAGGLRILAHLRSQLGEVHALAMDRATFEAHGVARQPLTAGDRAALGELRAYPALADRADLMELLLATGAKLEQEAVPAATVVSRLHSRPR
jgi:hypothetical protein